MKNKKGAWEQLYKKHGKYFEEVHKDVNKAAKLLKRKGVRRVLDLGCGSGRHVVYLTKQGFEVYGIDYSKTGIDLAGKWLANEHLSANLQVHDMAKRLPFENNFFDAVISIQVIHHAKLKTITKIISEIERVLVSGGFILITVPVYKKYDPKKAGWKMREINKHTFLPLDGPEKGLYHYFFTPEQMRKSFSNFEIEKLYVDYTNHLSLWGYKKRLFNISAKNLRNL